ncbi:MAG: hypothetical protein JO111_07395 [Caulobacteraceae bacterium]|nr:hypothetical protein [Caulobacteraceae bacterium]
MAARMKVYQASFGFHESVVAAPNQKAALEAWGARQNLFAEGLARVTDDDAATKAALAHPGQPLRRPLGATGAFSLDPSELPKVPMQTRPTPRKRGASTAKVAKPPRDPPDRGRLDAAEAALRAVQAKRRAAEDAFRARLHALEQERSAAMTDLDAKLAAAKAEVDDARRAYREARG